RASAIRRDDGCALAAGRLSPKVTVTVSAVTRGRANERRSPGPILQRHLGLPVVDDVGRDGGHRRAVGGVGPGGSPLVPTASSARRQPPATHPSRDLRASAPN